MKKILSFIFDFLLTVIMCGCYTPTHSQIDKEHYIELLIEDANKKMIYDIFEEESPVLSLQEDYYLRVHLGPGAMMAIYELTTVIFDETQIVLKEIEGEIGGLYSLKGVAECRNSKITVECKEGKLNNSTGECEWITIQESICVNFS